MVVAQASSSLCISTAGNLRTQGSRRSIPARISAISRLPGSTRMGTNFISGSSLGRTYREKAPGRKSTAVCVRSEQSSKDGSSLDVWLGRAAMIGFAAALSVEVSTGKGLLQNFGLTSPLPTVALAVTVLVGVLTAVFIFQSASDN